MSYTPIFHYECLKRAPSQSMEASGSLDGPESPTKSKDAPPLNVTCLEFDPLGRYLAIADVGGRVTVLNTNQNWSVAYEYRSHTQQFDCLKSQQIDEKINAIRWLKPISQSSSSLLVTNEKVIKLWRLHGNGEKSLRKSFQNHTCAINGLSLSMDGTCFASSDDLRVEYWHFDHPERSLNVLDIKPADMSDLSEVITGIAFHSEEPHLLAISSSSGNIKVVDVRNPVESRGKRSALLFEIPRGEENEMTDILSCVADCAFSNKNGGTLVTRDYLHVRSWDVRNPSAPVSTIPVHDHIVRPYLTDLYENDLIFDRFRHHDGGGARFDARR
eukprot:PhF_6_TR12231/c0_g1_i1/m.19366/K04354/PPP2R2; serine/threonine-protein phosphatase 2A regulatory subunit B